MISPVLFGVKPSIESSAVHPEVAFATMAAKVSLLHGPAEQIEVNQSLIGATIDEFPDPTKMGTKLEGLRHVLASGLAAMPASAAVQPDESPLHDMK